MSSCLLGACQGQYISAQAQRVQVCTIYKYSCAQFPLSMYSQFDKIKHVILISGTLRPIPICTNTYSHAQCVTYLCMYREIFKLYSFLVPETQSSAECACMHCTAILVLPVYDYSLSCMCTLLYEYACKSYLFLVLRPCPVYVSILYAAIQQYSIYTPKNRCQPRRRLCILAGHATALLRHLLVEAYWMGKGFQTSEKWLEVFTTRNGNISEAGRYTCMKCMQCYVLK